MTYERYAIYFMAPPGPLADFGAAWLGHDLATGAAVAHPDIADLPRPVETLSRTPRKYGFHGTIKPPFRLAEGADPSELQDAARDLCAGLEPAQCAALTLTGLGGFVALRPAGDQTALARVAAQAVEGLDTFRAPPPEDELARRRARGLSDRQEANLTRWGYPYVMRDFRFHMTLTGRLPPDEAEAVQSALAPHLAPILPAPFEVRELCLVGSIGGMFRLIERLPLGSQTFA